MMQKRGIVVCLIVSVLLISCVSAFSFSEFFDNLFNGGVTGNVVLNSDSFKTHTCNTNADCTSQGYEGCWSGVCYLPSYNPGASDFTVSAWIKTNDSNTIQSVVSHWAYGTTLPGWELYLNYPSANKLGFYDGSSMSYQVTSGINANEWYFISLVKQGDRATFYVNGVSKGSVYAQSVIPDSASKVVLGKTTWAGSISEAGYPSFVRSFKGQISNVNINQGQALSADTIKMLYDTSVVMHQGSCTENWNCGQWSESSRMCSNGIRTRTCTDNNNCGTTVNKPSTSMACGVCGSAQGVPSASQPASNLCRNGTALNQMIGPGSINWLWDCVANNVSDQYDSVTCSAPIINSTVPTPQQICNDSDGGNNIYVRGSINGDSTWTDRCEQSNMGWSVVNSCSGSGCRLFEYFCSANGQVNYAGVNCSNGCSNGACLNVSVTSGCNDSDGGIKHDVAGRINYFYNVVSDLFYGWHVTDDYCDADGVTLFEFACDYYTPTQLHPSSPYNCGLEGKVCRNGACVNQSSDIYKIILKGRLVDQITHEPVKGAQLISAYESSPSNVITDSYGNFQFTVSTDFILKEGPGIGTSRDIASWVFFDQCHGYSSSITLQKDYEGYDMALRESAFDNSETVEDISNKQSVDLGDIETYPNADISIESDIATEFNVMYKYKNSQSYNGGGQGGFIKEHYLSVALPLNYETFIRFKDQQGKVFDSTVYTIPFDARCSAVSLKYFNGISKWTFPAEPVCVPEMQCTFGPIVCPPSGIQTETCVDNNQCFTSEPVVKEVKCTPGVCAGCMMTDKCIPYGYRLVRLGQPSYCDIDGEFKVQQTKDANGDWAKCQNNYECESNTCSSGECIELKDIANQAEGVKGFFVKLICRLSNLFSSPQSYEQCVAEYLGGGVPGEVCGDGVINEGIGEECDGADLNERTCNDLGFSGGKLSCSDCQFDTSQCSSLVGESYKLEKTSTKFHVGYGILDVVSSSVTDDNLPTLLADGTYKDYYGDLFDYTQKLTLANQSLTMFEDNDYQADVPTLGMKITSGANVLNYTLDFTSDPSWSNLKGTNLVIMGNNYYILSASTNTSLTLLDSAANTMISEGQTKSLVLNGQTYKVSISFIGDNKVKLLINGQTTSELAMGNTFRLNDGTYLSIISINYNSKPGGVSSVELSLGKGKLVLEDGVDVELNDDSISDLSVRLASSNGNIQSIKIIWAAEDDLFVTEESSEVMPGFGSVKLSAKEVTFPTFENIIVEPDGDDSFVLESFPLQDSTEDINLLYWNGTGFGGIGEASDKQLRTSATTSITFDADTDAQFVASWTDEVNAASYLMRATSFVYDGANRTTFQYRKDGSWVDAKKDATTGSKFYVGNLSLTVGKIDKNGKSVVIDGSFGVSFNTLYSKEGMKVYLPIASDLQGSTYTLKMTEEDKNGLLGNGESIFLNLGGNVNGDTSVIAVNLSRGGISSEVGSTGVFRNFVYSALATEITFDKSMDQQKAALTYHGDESYGNIYLSSVVSG